MSTSATANANITYPDIGTEDSTWGTILIAIYDKLDDLTRGYLAINAAGSSDVTLSEAQWNHNVLKFTGVLTGNINVEFPDSQGQWKVWNATTGDFTLTAKTVSGTGAEIARNDMAHVVSDGTDCFLILEKPVGPGVDGYVAKSVAGSSNVTLTSTEYGNRIIRATGTLTGNIDLIFPTAEKGYWFENQTTGDFDITVKITGQNGFVAPQGYGLMTYSDGTDMICMGPPMAHGTVRLTKSGANLLLSAHDGPGALIINGRLWFLPNGGITLAATSLTPDTLYYIYSYVSSGALTLEASATVPTAANNGLQIKTGDASRTLVGMARVITGPAWADTAAQRFVASWFSRRPVKGYVDRSTQDNATTTYPTFAETNSAARTEFVAWAGDIKAGAICPQSAEANDLGYMVVGIDGVSTVGNESVFRQESASNNGIGTGISVYADAVTVGYHYATVGQAEGSGDSAAVVNSRTFVELMI